MEKYIYETLGKYGWETQRQKFHNETFQGWDSSGSGVGRTYQDLNGVNVIGTKNGTNTDQIVIIGAHYDTVDNTPGADDNGTGIAALLELARILGKHTFVKTLILVAFDMEEIGLLGSRAIIEKLPENAVVEGALIFDTMGYIDGKDNSQKIPTGFSLL